MYEFFVRSFRPMEKIMMSISSIFLKKFFAMPYPSGEIIL
jgi:hypothetical protein